MSPERGPGLLYSAALEVPYRNRAGGTGANRKLHPAPGSRGRLQRSQPLPGSLGSSLLWHLFGESANSSLIFFHKNPQKGTCELLQVFSCLKGCFQECKTGEGQDRVWRLDTGPSQPSNCEVDWSVSHRCEGLGATWTDGQEPGTMTKEVDWAERLVAKDTALATTH